MAETQEKLRCLVITPESAVLDTEVIEVVLPAHDGLLGILPNHGSLLCRLGSGLLRYRDSQKHEHNLFVDSGFGHVRQNELTVLTRQVVKPEDISQAEAKEQLIEAKALPVTTVEQVEARSAAIQRAKHLMLLAETLN